MAPLPTPALSPTELHLTFPSPSSLTSTAHLTHITHSAHSASHFTLLIKFAFSFPFHPAPSSSSSSSSSASSAAQVEVEEHFPTTQFHALQSFLSEAYAAATKVFIAEGRPLAQVDIVLDGMRELAWCETKGTVVSAFQVPEPEEEEGKQDKEKEEVGEGEGRFYEVTALGGTFDHLHAGHKVLLTMAAFLTTRRLIVGISDAPLLTRKKFPELLESLEERQGHVLRFVNLIKPSLVCDVPPLVDVYGPTAWDPAVEAIVVSEETRSGGEAGSSSLHSSLSSFAYPHLPSNKPQVNAERAKKSLSKLDVFVIHLISAEAETNGDVGGKMGSTGIREWLSSKRAGKERED